MIFMANTLDEKLKEDTISYGIASKKNSSIGTSFYYDYRVAEKYAEIEQLQRPDDGPFFIVKRTEHYEIVSKTPSEKGNKC